MTTSLTKTTTRSTSRSLARRDRRPLARGRGELRLESLEARQMMTADLADAIRSAPVFQTGGSLTGQIGDGSWGRRDVDIVGFQVAAGGRLTADIDARSLAGGSTLDSFLRVFDSSGRVLAFNDDFGGSLDSFVSLNVPSAGTYFIGVSGFGNSSYNALVAGSGRDASIGRYALTVTVVGTPADTDGSLGTARDVGALSGNRTFNDAIGGSDRNDYYRFSVTTTAQVGLRLDGMTSDADLELLDARGTLIARSAAGGTTADVIQQQLTTGTYFARVYPYSGSTNYTLTLSSGSTPTRYQSTTGWGLTNASAAVSNLLGNSAFPDVPNLGGREWGNDMVNAPEVWARGFTGTGVIVAVVDTGVDYNHPDLRQNIWVNSREIPGDGIDNDGNGFTDDVRGWDFVDRDANPMDIVDNQVINGRPGNIGHGTHVAGTIAAARNSIGSTGVAPDARIMPIRVLDHRGSGSSMSVANGIRYAANNGAHVINLSLGGGYSSDIESAIRHAVSRGCVVVVAAGNFGEPLPSNPANLAARIPGVISVGAVDGSQRLASFSNRAGSDSRMQHVVAPGVSIHSTLPNGNYGNLSGTSMAAPHVAGVAALMRSAASWATPQQIQQRITGTASQPSNIVLAQMAAPAAAQQGLMRTMAFAALAMHDGGIEARPRSTARAAFAALAAHG